jgi:predicted small secreted protein
MKKRASLLAIFLPMTLLLAACKNPLDGVTDINLNFNERVTVEARFENANGLATIGSLRVAWDGQTLQDLVAQTPADQVPVSGSRLGRETGSHRLSFQIVNQTTSPNTYRVTRLTITSYDDAGRVTGTLALEARTAALDTNDAITYDFRL